MNVTRGLVALYPPAVRDRWGRDLEDEARAAGWRGWLDLLIAMLGLWIHPAVWPAASTAQRRARAANLAIAVTGIGWLTGHALLELAAAVPRDLAHSWILTGCDGLTFLGFALVLPLPRRETCTKLVTDACRRFAGPMLLGGTVVLVVNSYSAPAGWPARTAVLACWWIALLWGVVQAVRVVASLDLGIVSTPGPRRLRLGLWFAVLGLTLSSAVIVTATLASGHDRAAGITTGCALLALAIATTGTVRDLAEVS
jgi:hypothetical protein